ncbi:ribonuclease Y [candidate division WWE3 bacterium RIFCSPLOWO2_01_FULL_39_13]|uniref:Ribonuclease Y n=1 Tax=candidate division WWE3 bacterium RIFCSPLOWO2_01_FULL_39_13 TaxID=1802624 RepID=A0A1F4V5G2_UNCKA|nr:MAG: ribonuclease Y [candidate division WWE3 bacterium RIFCSPLOWO2_01_FULL_39_13]
MSLDAVILSIITPLVTVIAAYFAVIKPSKENKKDTDIKKDEVGKEIKQKEEELLNLAKEKAKGLTFEAQSEAIKIRQNAENEAKNISQKAIELERKADKRLDEIYVKIKEIDEREKRVENTKNQLKTRTQEIENLRLKQISRLESIASLTKEEAKDLMIHNLEKTLENDIARRIKEYEEKLQLESDKIAKDILVDAMQHASTDYVPEYTISTVKLSDPDIKGRIIGKEGRNIKAFEDLTGVNVDFEENDEVRLSSFDAVRREIAKLSMEKLLKDGRIQPSRIEEIVKKTKDEMDKILLVAGEDLCRRVSVYNLPKELVQKLGHFKYRTSYGQNMVQHTLEETLIGVKIAHEIGADVALTKLACLLHDIGKIITDKEGSHIELGADYVKKFNIPQTVVTAILEHHEDKPSSVEGVIVQIADSISGSRPGARYEDLENYVKRMKSLEEIAASFDGVEKAYAISAGRELRVIVKPHEVTDAHAVKLSSDIAKKIEKEQTYPGTVNVVVIREVRAASTAT